MPLPITSFPNSRSAVIRGVWTMKQGQHAGRLLAPPTQRRRAGKGASRNGSLRHGGFQVNSQEATFQNSAKALALVVSFRLAVGPGLVRVRLPKGACLSELESQPLPSAAMR